MKDLLKREYNKMPIIGKLPNGKNIIKGGFNLNNDMNILKGVVQSSLEKVGFRFNDSKIDKVKTEPKPKRKYIKKTTKT
jgi:hypothetical protein